MTTDTAPPDLTTQAADLINNAAPVKIEFVAEQLQLSRRDAWKVVRKLINNGDIPADSIIRDRGGRPRVPDEAKRFTPRITVRFTDQDEIDTKINKPAEAVGLDRSEQVRRMLTYAAKKMPANWGLDRDWTLE